MGNTILGANTLSSGYEVANSCMFNDGDSACMHKTPSSSGNRRTFTFSTWVKKTNDLTSNVYNDLYSAYDDSNNISRILFWDSNALTLSNKVSGSFPTFIRTNRLFKDPTAWYHLVIAVDTTDGTEANRVKIYVNGIQETSLESSNYPSQNEDFFFNHTNEHNVGQQGDDDSALYFDGYLAETVMIDGLQLAPTSFGEFDEDTPKTWKPIDVSGLTFGTNGFYLDYEDSSNLGNDKSGGTDFTEVYLAATDQSTDTCTNNFAVCNSSDSFSTGGTFSDGNMITQSTTSNRGIFTATMGVSTGKWYWEIKTSASGGTHASDEWNYIGIANNIGASNTDNILATSGTDSNAVYEYAIHGHDGDFYNNGDQGTYAASFTTGDIIGVFLDLDNNKIYWSKNGSWADGSGNSDEADPNGFKSVTDPASTPGGFYFPAWGDGGSNMNKTWQLNFGGTPSFSISSANADPNGYGSFEYPTEGGYALCTKNLAEFG